MASSRRDLARGHLLFANEKCATVVSSFMSIVGRQRPRRQGCQADRLEAIKEEGEPLTRTHPRKCDDGNERTDGEPFENDSPHEKGYHIAAARQRNESQAARTKGGWLLLGRSIGHSNRTGKSY